MYVVFVGIMSQCEAHLEQRFTDHIFNEVKE